MVIVRLTPSLAQLTCKGVMSNTGQRGKQTITCSRTRPWAPWPCLAAKETRPNLLGRWSQRPWVKENTPIPNTRLAQPQSIRYLP
ncbi:hypothetical protein AVEN_142608-1 [Araneus ventricosus]|uniref:Uncharacterized protein n=1 Tax=Araneus ventricosus TaxID=182803 RepID=A0A4Y2G6X9_ARAVE|nr:hypothetical protein AVEN_142608-1 [Araneus ventricosus]